jgi:hypothetical protein
VSLVRIGFALATGLLAVIDTAGAQQNPEPSDSTRTQIHRTIRAFYYNLAHGDWEALAADILPAKVLAHRAAPWASVAVAPSSVDAGCPSAATPIVEQAAITVQGDRAAVSVPRCTGPGGLDQFRLVRFERRWRFVHIELFREPPHLVSEW